jgi:hypothetical protein
MSILSPVSTAISLTSPLVPAQPPTTPPAGATGAAWDRLEVELRRLGGLGADWDGQGATAPDAANVTAALRWVAEMRRWLGALPPTRAVPGTTGEVMLEWRGEAFYLAAEISGPSRIEWLLDIPGQPLRQWDTDASRPWIVRTER